MKASLSFPSASEKDAPPWRHWSIKGAIIIRAGCQLCVSFLPLPYVSCCLPVCSRKDKSRGKEREKTPLSSCDTVICYQYAAMILMGPLVRTWHASPRPFRLIFFSKWGSRQLSITAALCRSPETPRSTVIIWNSCSERFCSITQNGPETHRTDRVGESWKKCSDSTAGKMTRTISHNAQVLHSQAQYATCSTWLNHVRY